MDNETFAALQNIMIVAKHLGIDDDHFDDFMTITDWMREHTSLYAPKS